MTKLHVDADLSTPRFELQMRDAQGKIVASESIVSAEAGMRCYVRWSQSGFGSKYGVGANVALVDRLMKLDAGAVYEGKGLVHQKFWKDDGRAFFDQIERSMREENDRRLADTEQVPVDGLAHDRLDWAVADAVGMTKGHAGASPVWQLGVAVYGMPGFMDGSLRDVFSPTRDAALAGRLADQEGIGVQRIAAGHWRAQLPDGSCVGNGPDSATARLRSLVKVRTGEMIAMPKAVPVQVMENDAPTDDVIAQRVAAVLNHYHRADGAVSCTYDNGSFRVQGATLSVHPGSNARERTFTLLDTMTREAATAMARSYPQLVQTREERAAFLNGPQNVEHESSFPREERVAITALRQALHAMASERPGWPASAVPADATAKWAAIEWAAARALCAYEGATPESIVDGMRGVSPVCILDEEAELLGEHLHEHIALRKQLTQAQVEPSSAGYER